MYKIPNKALLNDKALLSRLYVEQYKSTEEIGQFIGCSKHSVLRALKTFNIPLRKRTTKNPLLNDKEQIRRYYLVDNLSLPQIATLTKSTIGNIWTILQTLGIQTRNYKEGLNARFPDGRRNELSANWRGGITTENYRARRTDEYRAWRKAVFERDNYTCQICGQKGGDLEADHIKQFAYHPELRLTLENGRTLCKECHKKTPSHSKKQ